MTQTFDIVSTNNASASVALKGNVIIEYGKKGSSVTNSVYSYDNQSKYAEIEDSNGERLPALYTDDDCYNAFIEIVGSDLVLEEKDLLNIDEVAKKFKGTVQVDKTKLKEGEITLNFKNGSGMTIDFETSKEREFIETLHDRTTDSFTKGLRAICGAIASGAANYAESIAKQLDRFFERLETFRPF